MLSEKINELTLEEKALLFSGKTVWETFDILDKGIPSIFLADGPHGLRKQEGASDHLGLNKSVPATCFPTAATLANSWDVELLEKIGVCLGDEAQKNDVQVLLGPGLNIKRNPLCGRNFEYFSEDPYLSGKMAASLIKGVQQNGTIASPKHFAANSQELRRMASDSIIDEQTLREIYLTAFEIAVKEGKPKSIMSSYNLIDGIYANENKKLLRNILIDEWGFKGFVVSDWGGSNNHVQGLINGSHLEMPSTGYHGPMEIVDAVNQGRLSTEILNERAEELLNVILSIPKKSNQDTSEIDFDLHHEVAHQAAVKSIVMLKNNNGCLPVNQESKVGVIGDFAINPRFQGSGSSIVNAKDVEDTMSVIKKYPLNIFGFARGFNRDGTADDSLLNKAVKLAENCDVVLLHVGLNETDEVEGKDRNHISLNNNQLELIDRLSTLDTKVIAVISSGSVIDLSWENKVDAILHAYLYGEAGASAMLDLITGVESPSGKLAESYPISFEEIPFVNEYPSKEEQVFYKEGLFVGYRYYDKALLEVRYPFGFGLSYSKFEYSELEIKSDSVSFYISNIGDYDAEEIVQLYIQHKSTDIIRPESELKGFKKVFIPKGEKKKVTIAFDEYTFRFYNAKTQKWETETADYQIRIGSSSRDIRLKGMLKINGDYSIAPYEKLTVLKYFDGPIIRIEKVEFEKLLGRTIAVDKLEKGSILKINNTLSDMAYAKNPLARFIAHRINQMIIKSEKSGKPDLNLLFIYNLPFRGIAKMTNGMVTMNMVDGILLMVNGHFFKGVSRLIRNMLRDRKLAKDFEKKIGRA